MSSILCLLYANYFFSNYLRKIQFFPTNFAQNTGVKFSSQITVLPTKCSKNYITQNKLFANYNFFKHLLRKIQTFSLVCAKYSIHEKLLRKIQTFSIVCANYNITEKMFRKIQKVKMDTPQITVF